MSQSFKNSAEATKIKKAIGFGKESELYPRRHFGSRAIKRDFPVVSAFKLSKATKICGISIPANTKLYVEFQSSACEALADGSLGISGIPLSLVPKLKSEKVLNQERLVECTTKTQQSSNESKLRVEMETAGKKAAVVPKVDWRDCECKLAENLNL